jgi:glutamine amidotransferase
MTVALIDYGAGNLHSVHNALRAAGADEVAVTADPETVLRADRVVLPGVGAFTACMAGLEAIPGMIEAMEQRIFHHGRPFLGVCVGMQLMAEYGVEHGVHKGMGWVPGSVIAIPPSSDARVPHMGWNDVIPVGKPSLIEPGEAYFLHSFAFDEGPSPEAARAVTRHGGREIVAAIQVGPALGVQFHPEKSQRYGIALLERFLAWRP